MEGPKVGGEVRKVHVLYFLSHNGKIEQPHLIRVHHLSRNGVHLRDVKRWLYDLRGKDVADSYAWSYKRRYKSGYVWQDLKDDDLITPISDNEYVLKGSNISSKSELPPPIETITEEEAKLLLAPKTSTRPETIPQKNDESPSDVSDESVARRIATVKIDSWTQRRAEQKKELSVERREEAEAAAAAADASWWSPRRTSNLLHKLFACRRVDTSDSVLTVRSPKTDSVGKGSYKRTNGTDNNNHIAKGKTHKRQSSRSAV